MRFEELMKAKETLQTYCESLAVCEGCAFNHNGVCRVGYPPNWGDEAVSHKREAEQVVDEEQEKVENDPVGERCKVLLQAVNAVCSDRNQRYGEPEDNFGAIAELWNAYIRAEMPEGACVVDLGARQVADMMILFKVGRAATAIEDHRDTYVDIAGYAACAGGMCTDA